MDFSTFKQLYGHKEPGVRLVKVGNEMVKVDSTNFTYNVITEKDNDKRTRILQGTVASQ